MIIIKPLYGIAEIEAYWWSTYFKHYCEKLKMEFSIYNPCLLVTLLESECFGVIGMQTDDILGFGDEAFITKKSKKLVFAAKEKQFFTSDNALLFNGCILTLVGDTLRLRQKNQGKKLEKATDSPTYVQQRARGAYIATICQPEASFDLSAAAQVTDPGKKEIARLNRRINWQRKNFDRGLNYVPIDLNTMKFFVIMNASFANNADLTL
jgi:hypothetical protein